MMPLRVFVSPTDQTRSEELDAVRFVLAMWVLLAHAVGWGVYVGTLNPNGVLNDIGRFLVFIFQREGETHPAVLAFIVLSGYCIHRNGFRLDQKFCLKNFGIRRFFRIFPVYFLATVVGILFWYVAANTNLLAVKALTGTEKITLSGIVVKLTGLSSFVPSIHAAGWQGNAPLTTAIVEAWLYVFYAFVVWYVTRGYRVLALVYWLIGAWLLMFFYVFLNPKYTGWWHNGSFISFALYWWIGAVFVIARPALDRGSYFFKILALGVLVFAIGNLGAGLIPSELRKIGLAFVIAIFIQSIDRNCRNKIKPFKLLQSGYSVYALHAPLLIIFLVNGFSFVFSVCATLVIALSCYLFFEQPLLDMGKRISMHRAK